jgi:hypothetical protein
MSGYARVDRFNTVGGPADSPTLAQDLARVFVDMNRMRSRGASAFATAGVAAVTAAKADGIDVDSIMAALGYSPT